MHIGCNQPVVSIASFASILFTLAIGELEVDLGCDIASADLRDRLKRELAARVLTTEAQAGFFSSSAATKSRIC